MSTKYHSTVSGCLPPTADAAVAGVSLPAGLHVFPTEASPPRSRPVLWVSTQPHRSLSAVLPKLYSAFPTTGLWPLALQSLRGVDERPWVCGELDPGPCSAPDRFEALPVLSEWWVKHFPAGDDPGEHEEFLALVAPFQSTFPGLAPHGKKPAAEGSPPEVANALEGRLGLVPTRRPADIPALIGWMGPLNWFSDMAPLSCVLRSWEERFDAFLVGMGFDTISLAVGRPPRSLADALPIAAEHFAACSDNILQGVGTVQEYAEELVGAPCWTFWWD